MIDTGIIITGCIGIVTTMMSSWATWFFSRKKYNSEVNTNEIENLKKSLEFYEKIVKDNTKQLELYIDLVEDYRVEVYTLKGIINRLLNNSCLDNKCLAREFYTEEQIREILDGITPAKDRKDGTTAGEEIS